MKLLILSFYYTPDLGAGSFRTDALIKELQRYSAQGLEVDLITTQPNRYNALAKTVGESEDHGWLRIKRIGLPQHQSGMMDQAKAFISFAQGVHGKTKDGDWDMVFATSGRLMTAALGAFVSQRLGLPLYLDIRDLFTDTMSDILKGSFLHHLLPIFRHIERRTFKAATRINVVSPAFQHHVNRIVPDLKLREFTNGIDSDFLRTNFHKYSSCKKLPVILYAGNIGESQGLHHILPDLASSLNGQAIFRIIGDGGRLTQLKETLDKSNIINVELHPPLPRNELLKEYHAADVFFLHLNDHPAFLKVIPSKIFEYAATEKPIVAGVAGYPAEFIRKQIPGAYISDPCDVQGMIRAVIGAIKQTEPIDRKLFFAEYNRATIMKNMVSDILSTPLNKNS